MGKKKTKLLDVWYVDTDGHFSAVAEKGMSIEEFRCEKQARIAQGRNLTLTSDDSKSLDFHHNIK